MPLYVTNGKLQLGEPGKLAAQRACCCNEEGDNPEDCVCPDECVYDASVTSPVSVRLLVTPCGYGNPVLSGSYDPFSDCPGVAVGVGLAPLPSGLMSSGNYVGFVASRGAYTTNSGEYPDILEEPPIETITSWSVSVWIFVNCVEVIDDNNINKPPKIVVSVSLNAQAGEGWPRSQDAKTGGVPIGQRRFSRNAIFTIPSTCSKKSGLSCQGDSSLIRAAYFQSPFVLTVTKETVNGIAWSSGEFYGGVDDAFGSQENVGCLNDVIDNFSATFRIKQRASCRVVACNCSTSINGLKATFDGKEFTLGTPHTIEEGNTRWQHEIDGAGSYNFYKDTFLPENVDCGIGSFSVPVELITLSLYCATDSTADPPTPRWMVEATTICAPTNVVDCELVATGFAQRLFNGHIPCYEAEPGCVGPPGGAYIPIGDPIDIVEADGSPFLNPELPDCGASDFPSFRLEQNCSA